MAVSLDASKVVANCLRTVEPRERHAVLAALMANSAGALVAICGQEKAAEACYALGDYVVSSEPSER